MMRSTTVGLIFYLLNHCNFVGVKAFKHERYGFGIYEGQCDKNGNTCGEGRWVCTEPPPGRDPWKGIVVEGTFKNDIPTGFGMFFLSIDSDNL